ncbi:hypothetical protein TrST_g5581 [Triparma strigata]|uniref:Macro domain-containing protein n=1 Tax=Triparma strigata TaxID=1606541 RepID=A0A9W7AZ31_9STRA|nr:hypothetical protein TrST_g5581 [Triparma strigata]
MIQVSRFAAGRIQLWITPCAVTMPPPGSDSLAVPTNERLCGTQFSHFPVGGPTPVQEYIGRHPKERVPEQLQEASWMLYQCESIDGVVTELGGIDRSDIDERAPVVGGDEQYPVRCRVGDSLLFSSSGGLEKVFEKGLVLTVPPFWPGTSSAEWRRLLRSSYLNTFSVAKSAGSLAITTPLLGSGARGTPTEQAAEIAAEASVAFVKSAGEQSEMSILFAVQDDDVGEALDKALHRHDMT